MTDLRLTIDRFLKRIGAYSFITDEDIERAALFRRLPRKTQDLLQLVNIDDHTVEEAAALLGLKPEEAQAMLDRAYELLDADERPETPDGHQDGASERRVEAR